MRCKTRNQWASTISIGRNRQSGELNSQCDRDVVTASTRRRTQHAHADATRDRGLAPPQLIACDRNAAWTQ